MHGNNNKVFSQQQFKQSQDPQRLLSESSSHHTDSFSLKRGKLLILLFAILLVLALCFLPLPSRIHLSLPGGQIDRDGTLIQEGEILLHGRHYEYLLRDDKIKLETEVPGLTLDNSTWHRMTYTTVLGDFMHASQLVYVEEFSGYILLRISLANDYSWCLIQAEEYLFFGTTNPDLTAEAVITSNPLLIN